MCLHRLSSSSCICLSEEGPEREYFYYAKLQDEPHKLQEMVKCYEALQKETKLVKFH